METKREMETAPMPNSQSTGCDSTFFAEQQRRVNEIRAMMSDSYDPRVTPQQ